MATEHETDAHVVIDGELVPVYARLIIDTSGPLKTWYGTLTSDTSGLAFKLLTGQRSLLRMPSGREAPIVPGGNSSEGIAFTGSGPAPI
ncbi:hypothetical protein [Streptomyces sp. NPDC002692]